MQAHVFLKFGASNSTCSNNSYETNGWINIIWSFFFRKKCNIL